MKVSSAGKAQPEVQAMKCSTFKNAINIIVDTPMKNICKEFWSFKKLLIAPYVPIILNRSNPEANLYQKFRPAEVRPIMVSRSLKEVISYITRLYVMLFMQAAPHWCHQSKRPEAQYNLAS